MWPTLMEMPYRFRCDRLYGAILELNRAYGAVTGNPRVRNRSTILGRLLSEFSSLSV